MMNKITRILQHTNRKNVQNSRNLDFGSFLKISWPKSRKGFLASYIVDFYAYLVFVAILIVFFIVLIFIPPPANQPIKINQAIISDTTTILIRSLEQPIIIDGKTTTPAEIISNEDRQHEKEAKQTLQAAIETTYPPKKEIQHFWFGVYPANKLPNNLCQGAKTMPFSFSVIRGFSSSNVARKSTEEAVPAIVNIPLKNTIDYVTLLLCIGGEHFR